MKIENNKSFDTRLLLVDNERAWFRKRSNTEEKKELYQEVVITGLEREVVSWLNPIIENTIIC